MKKKTQLIIGASAFVGAFLVAFSPLALAFLSTPPGGNMWSEGGDGGGSAIWLMILTLPLGLVIGIVGLVFLIMGLVTKSQPKQ